MAAGVIFDCDGTLLDTIDAWHEVEDRLLADAGITLSKAERDELSSLTLDEAGVFFCERFDGVDTPEQVRELIVEHLLDYYRTRSAPVPGAEAFAAQLHRRGVPMAVLSSSPQSFLQAGLRTVGVFSSDNCGTHEELARYSERVIEDFTELLD